jgi:thioredoxin-related protein
MNALATRPALLPLILFAMLSACSRSPETPVKTLAAASPPAAVTQPAGRAPAAASAADAVAWYPGTVEGAFAEAKKTGKPVFLFWGAAWCPYCAQVKATVFNRADFAERARAFVPVYLDGDSHDAQKLAEHFRVRGYPTMLLLKPDGTELTRLPGEVDAERYMQVLALGMGADRPIRETLDAALKGETLPSGDWQRLAYYAFDTDEASLIPSDKLSEVLAALAGRCPKSEGALSTRLALRSLIASLDAPSPAKLDKPALRRQLGTVLADPAEAREMFDLIVNAPDKQIAALTDTKSSERKTLATAWDKVLATLAADAGLSTTDRLDALDGRVAIAHLATPDKLPPALVETLRDAVAEADRDTTNPFERQSVIYTAAGTLTDARLLDDSDALLKAELPHSHTPYYFMRMLGTNAKLRGDAAGALDWYAQAWKASEGGATRLQWGTGYLNGLLELAPADEARIEEVGAAVFGEAAKLNDAYAERNRAALERTAGKLNTWNRDDAHSASFERLATRFSAVCGKLPAGDPQRTACDGLLKRKS